MDRSIDIYTKRRVIRSAILFVAAVAIFYVNMLYDNAMYKAEFFNGWILISLFIFLALFNVRKKISFLPIGSGYNWAQLHVYGGFLIAFVFFLHIGFSMPTGIFDSLLAVLFIVEIISGLLGIVLHRVFPKLLARSQLDDDIMYERIPGIRSNITDDIEELITKALTDEGSTAMSDFYQCKLQPFLKRPENFWTHLFNARRVYVVWGGKFESLHRFLNDNEKLILAEVRQLTMAKIDLDARYAKQSLMKRWLFLHIPLSYGLLLFVMVHMTLVYSYFGAP